MEITKTIKPSNQDEWRIWLATYSVTLTEIWLLFDDFSKEQKLEYIDAVYEAICFGWIDGIQKRFSGYEVAQRFTPRKKRSNWTELNKERARYLVRIGKMTDQGKMTLSDLDIQEELRLNPNTWANFKGFPDLYCRVRIGYIEEMRKNPNEFNRRLKNFVNKTAENKMFGNWNDGGRLL